MKGRRAFRLVALAIAVLSAVAWFALGANRGWTRTGVAVRTVDEVTGIEGIQYRKQFVPGVDLLACAFTGAGLLAGTSFFFNRQQPDINN